MKYLILVTDGAGDEAIPALGGLTPLEAARLPNINKLAAKGQVGMVSTIPKGMAPGSDAANLSVMGYEPETYHTGRSPLEAVSMGIQMKDSDVAFRCNLVTLEGESPYEEKIIVDHSSGDISTEEAGVLVDEINRAFATDTIKFYRGFSYRHAMIVADGSVDFELVPPHDILGRVIGEYLPSGQNALFIREMMEKSFDLLDGHPVNEERKAKGLRPANSIWIWGQGRKPSLPLFYDKYGVRGATVSAVDLIKGIGLFAGLEAIYVPGATGTIDTDYEGKAQATIDAFERGLDFVYLHLEGPDECSHQGDLEGKIKSLELIDQRIVKTLIDYLDSRADDYRFMILPDHQTPLSIRTHLGEPVPFVLYDSSQAQPRDENRFYGESSGRRGLNFSKGCELTDYFFRKA